MSTVADSALATPSKAGLRAWYALVVMLVALIFGAVDRQILVLVTEPLKANLHLTDSQIGVLLGLGPGLFAAAAAILTGWLADRVARQLILFGCVVFWSIATAGFAVAHSFIELLIATCALGLGEAAMGPVILSIVPDLFPGKSRQIANLLYYGCLTIGAGFGVELSGDVLGWVKTHHNELPAALAGLDSWRDAFILVAIPGMVIGPAMLLMGRVPRTTAPAGDAPKASLAGYLRDNAFAILALCLSLGLYGISVFAIITWMGPHVIRDLHMSQQSAGHGLGIALAAGSIVGLVAAGVCVRLFGRRFGVIAPLRLYQAAMVCATIPMFLQIFAREPWEVFLSVGVQVAASTMGAALTPSLMQDIAPAEIRGRIIGIVGFLYITVGCTAPILVGLVSDLFKGIGLLWAIEIVSLPTLLLAAALVILADRPLQRTIRAYAPPAE